MSEYEKRRRGSLDAAAGTARADHASPFPYRLTVPRGSDAFQSALNDVMEDMKKLRKKEKGEDDEEDLSDEERDKFPEEEPLRKHSDNTHNRRLAYKRTGSFKDQHMPLGITHGRPPPMRRHSIATIDFKRSPFPH